MNGITLKENQSLFFQAEDKDGHILATNSISIFKIGKMNPNDFKVELDTSQRGRINFTTHLSSNGMIYNDVFFKVSSIDGLYISEEKLLYTDRIGGDMSPYLQFTEISANSKWSILNDSASPKSFTLYFEVRNKVTGEVMTSKSFNCTIHVLTDSEINGGSVDGVEDPTIGNNGSSNGVNSLFGGYSPDGFDLNMSFDDIMNTAKGSFNTFKMIFSILPSFIWILVALGISISIILRIVGR